MELTVENICFGYTKTKLILNNISFSIKEGETIAIVGSSGSGKTSLLKIIASLLPNNKSQKYSGEIKIDKTSINDLKLSGGLAYMFQEPTLMPNLTVKGNIEFPEKILHKSFNKSVEDTIRIVGLTDAVNKYPKDLSGGMKTRCSMARNFISQPKLLMLDEPFSSLDIGWKNSLYKELKTLQKRDNTAIVMVTHDIDEAIELADKILILSHSGTVLKKFLLTETNRDDIRIKAKQIILDDHNDFITAA